MRVLLVPNTGNPKAVAAASELATWLIAQGLEPVLSTADAAASGLADFGSEEALVDCVLVVALGGDGTILKAASMLGGAEIPILGVNMGRLGFLSGAGPLQMREAVGDALAGDTCLERRATLSCTIATADGESERRFALNEIVVGRISASRVVSFDLSVSGRLVTRFRGDAAIVATATGSTAYALSAGGPIVAPDFTGMVVVPVAPHTLTARPLVTSGVDVVEIVLSDPARADACVTIDGIGVHCDGIVDRVTVSRGEHDVLLVRHDGRGFYDAVAAEFFGG
jgi:NAD+ kinase